MEPIPIPWWYMEFKYDEDSELPCAWRGYGKHQPIDIKHHSGNSVYRLMGIKRRDILYRHLHRPDKRYGRKRNLGWPYFGDAFYDRHVHLYQYLYECVRYCLHDTYGIKFGQLFFCNAVMVKLFWYHCSGNKRQFSSGNQHRRKLLRFGDIYVY